MYRNPGFRLPEKASGRAMLAAALVASFVSLGVGASDSASAATASAPVPSPSPSTGWPARFARPAADTCPAGQTEIAATSGWTDSAGVAHFTYKDRPGMVSTLPATTVDASQVSNTMLTELGLPTGSTRQNSVQHAVAMSQKTVAPALCVSQAPAGSGFVAASGASGTSGASAASGTSGTASGGSTAGEFTHAYSGAWGGSFVTEGEYGSPIESVTGDWTVNNTQTPSGDSPAVEGTWVGIGGGVAGEQNGWGLIQAGTSMETGTGYQSWFELISGNCSGNGCAPRYSAVDVVRPGDLVSSEVTWENTSTACFDLIDYDHSAATIPWTCVPISTVSGMIYDHDSAEWINESWLSQGTPYYQNPGTVEWSDQSMSSGFDAAGPWSSPWAHPSTSMVMVVPGTSGSPNPSCGTPGVMSYPVGPYTTSGIYGSSQLVTCTGYWDD